MNTLPGGEISGSEEQLPQDRMARSAEQRVRTERSGAPQRGLEQTEPDARIGEREDDVDNAREPRAPEAALRTLAGPAKDGHPQRLRGPAGGNDRQVPTRIRESRGEVARVAQGTEDGVCRDSIRDVV